MTNKTTQHKNIETLHQNKNLYIIQDTINKQKPLMWRR